jgi:hypothetical protein
MFSWSEDSEGWWCMTTPVLRIESAAEESGIAADWSSGVANSCPLENYESADLFVVTAGSESLSEYLQTNPCDQQ